jgi:hypothetical protein
MITTVYRSEFHDYFTKSDTYKNNFSYEAREILFDYFEGFEDDTNEKIEFDLVGICCDFSESTMSEIIFDYGYLMTEEQKQSSESVREFLEYRSIVCGEYVDSDGETVFVYAQF